MSNIVDITEIEQCKENIQPLKRGRNAKALLNALKPSDPLSKFGPQRKAMEKKIKENAKGEDPLAPWLEYINWTQQSYLAANRKSYLIPLLEKCTRTFKNSETYKQDTRYIDIWLQYADACPNPIDIYNFMETNQIGVDFAKFYIAQARLFEERKLYKKAEEAVGLGLARSAGPVVTLARAQRGLQERAAKRMVELMNQADEIPEEEDMYRPALQRIPVNITQP